MIEPTDFYTGPERRRPSAVPLEPLEGVVERLMVKIIARHEQTERAMWDEMMSRAFPDGDPESHRDYHQAKIDAAVAEKEFYQSLKMKLAEAGALGALKLVLWLLMMGLGAAIAGKFGVLPLFFGGCEMTLHDEWATIMRKAWSVRLLVVAFVLSAAEVILPFFDETLPKGIFAALSGLTVAGAFVARLVAQKEFQ